jgi:glycosyltransferase involved in cell wall biosynthesis
MRDVPLSVLVIQMGARRRYELARMLQQHDVLAALHTSTAWREGEVPSLLYRKLFGVTEGVVKRRTVLGVPGQKVRTTVLTEPLGMLFEWLGAGQEMRFRAEDWVLGRSARRAGLAGASIVLSTTGNGGVDFLRWARGQGARIVNDIVITPRVYDILAEERLYWPGWELARRFAADAACYRRHMEKVVAVSDLLISPSDTVDDGLTTVTGFDARKLVRVPYSLGASTPHIGVPVPKRVLFAGQAGLRKGIPYLAEAARLLMPLGYEFRVAGTTPAGIRERPECTALTFLGHLGPDELAAEMRSADVFCLPSLAEGMASVTLEALCAGLPCVVTRSAGAPVRDGLNGAIVPERNGPAIAEAIRGICEDRPARARMSEAALAIAVRHRLDLVGDRLIEVLAGLAR